MEILYFNKLDSTQIKELELGNFPENKIEQYPEKVEKFKKLCGGQLGLTLNKKESCVNIFHEGTRVIVDRIQIVYTFTLNKGNFCTFTATFKFDSNWEFYSLDYNYKTQIATTDITDFIDTVMKWLETE